MRRDEQAKLIVKLSRLVNQDIDSPADFSEPNTARDAVGEMMVFANRTMAEEARKHGLPWLFRNHAHVVPRKLRDFDITQPEQTIEQLLDAMGRARYSPTAMRHEGLNLLPYCHFTSPLRRYADLINHITLHALLSGEPLPYDHEMLEQISDKLTQMTAHEIGLLAMRTRLVTSQNEHGVAE